MFSCFINVAVARNLAELVDVNNEAVQPSLSFKNRGLKEGKWGERSLYMLSDYHYHQVKKRGSDKLIWEAIKTLYTTNIDLPITSIWILGRVKMYSTSLKQ